jgi:c-di-GMP-binding flagellar brake protein YcgR
MNFLSKILGVVSSSQGQKDLLVEKRGHPRIKCSIDGKVVPKSGKESEECKIIEVGTKGMRIESVLSAKPGEVIFVRIRADQGSYDTRYKMDKVRAEVVWSRRKSKTYENYIGAKYADTENNIRNSWVTFLLKKFGLTSTSTMQRRKDVRASSRLPVYFKAGSEESKKGVAYNIGMGGILLVVDEDVPQGAELTIAVGPYDKLKTLNVQGKVARKRYSEKTAHWTLGVSFINLSNDAIKILGDYVLTVLRESALK